MKLINARDFTRSPSDSPTHRQDLLSVMKSQLSKKQLQEDENYGVRRGSVSSRRSSTVSRRSSTASRRSSTASRRSLIESFDPILDGLPTVPYSFHADEAIKEADSSSTQDGVSGPRVRPRISMIEQEQAVPEVSPNPQPKKKLSTGHNAASLSAASAMLNHAEFDGLAAKAFSTGMSPYMRIASESQSLVLSRCEVDKELLILQTAIIGDVLGTIETSPNKECRILRDAFGNFCAVIFRSIRAGQHKFKICCDIPMNESHRRSNDSGYYTWAEAKNSSGLGVKFSMKLRGENDIKYTTESFGPTLLKRGTPRGFLINQGKHPCARMTYLGHARGIVVGPNMDLCLMACFAAIVDEMVEHRML